MIEELDCIVLVEEHNNLPIGTRGTVLEIFNHGESYLIETFNELGESLGVESIKPEKIKEEE